MDTAVKKRNRDIFETARERLRKDRKISIEALFLTHREDAGADRCFFLATGIDHGNFLYSSVLIERDGNVRLFVHELEEEEVRPTGLPYTTIKPGQETLIKALKEVGGAVREW